LARVLHILSSETTTKKISRAALIESTGLANRQIESLVSIGAAMGLIRRGAQILTPAGRLVAQHDIFLESKGALEWSHWKGAGSPRNLIWHAIFNELLPNQTAMNVEGWMAWLRNRLAGEYTDRTIGKHLHEEVRFVVDAYLGRNFSRLELLAKASDGRLYRRRYASPDPAIFCGMLYDYALENRSTLLQSADLLNTPGSPALVFAMDDSALQPVLEVLHSRRWIRLERTHDLNQVRLLEGFEPLLFLQAYFENREPMELIGRSEETKHESTTR